MIHSMAQQRITRRRASAPAVETPEPMAPELIVQPGATPVQQTLEVETTVVEAPEPVAPEPVAPEPVAPEPVAPEVLEPLAPETQETETESEVEAPAPLAVQAAAIALPDVTAPAVSAATPRSFKLGMASKNFITSSDGGQTNTDSGLTAVAGCPLDLQLQITEANGRDYAFDIRFRLAFMSATGELCELNLNACNTSREGALYVTGSVRSLLAALLHVTENGEDMAAFVEGARFRLRQGDASKSRSGRATMFCNLDVANGDSWMEFDARNYWSQSPSTAPRLVQIVTMIKQRFNDAGLLMRTPAVVGAELLETGQTVETSFTTV
jgi:hypothetical protein